MDPENMNDSPEYIGAKNAEERERAHVESKEALNQRLEKKAEFPATESERRIGAYKEMLEPQVRDAVLALVDKGYITIDSGYVPRRVSEGAQYLGFRKGMIDALLLPLIKEKISTKRIDPEIESDPRSDYLTLVPKSFLTIEEWKEVWDAVASAFPDRGKPAPIRERFIEKSGH